MELRTSSRGMYELRQEAPLASHVDTALELVQRGDPLAGAVMSVGCTTLALLRNVLREKENEKRNRK
jgi:hypothetical protein